MIIHTGYSFSRMSIIMSLSNLVVEILQLKDIFHITLYFVIILFGVGIFSPEFKEKDRI